MNILRELQILATKMPSGLNDPTALMKLWRELKEFESARIAGDRAEIILELADILYYVAKLVHTIADELDTTPETLYRIAYEKYAMRSAPGNPKDPASERRMAERILLEDV
jgi:phosphoribosyl-ATP pyrophosphohydrolase